MGVTVIVITHIHNTLLATTPSPANSTAYRDAH